MLSKSILKLIDFLSKRQKPCFWCFWWTRKSPRRYKPSHKKIFFNLKNRPAVGVRYRLYKTVVYIDYFEKRDYAIRQGFWNAWPTHMWASDRNVDTMYQTPLIVKNIFGHEKISWIWTHIQVVGCIVDMGLSAIRSGQDFVTIGDYSAASCKWSHRDITRNVLWNKHWFPTFS